MAATNGTSNPVVVTPAELASMLRKSADIVERNEFHPLLYQTMKVLTAYAGEYAENASVSNHSGGGDTRREVPKSAFHDVPDSVLDGPLRNSTASASSSAGGRPQSTATGSQYNNNISSGNSVASEATSNTKVKPSAFSLKGIKKGLQKIGGEFYEHATATTAHTKDDAPFDEYAWCDEHFTRGCACKVRKEKTAESTSNSTHTNTHPTEEKTQQQSQQAQSKPCFQRPINPSSNLIANGWIDQQRRSKMRVVWKEILASLVEGRRPGEETTLWIQRQVLDPLTGKVTGLEALHQVPMKWLEDVNYVDVYGDHRFTLKVYNIAEEFYFRTRDEQSAQSWVLTLRSARDASLESVRMGKNGQYTNVRPNSGEVGGMGLNNLEDWDNNSVGGKQQVEESRPSSAPTQTQQSGGNSARMTISELRSIAHGAGYDTRGMERQDLERIVAMIRNQAPVSGGAPASTSTSPGTNQDDVRAEEERKVREAEEEFLKQKHEMEKRRAAAAELEQRRRQEEEERKRQLELQQQQAAAAELRRKEEAERQRQLEEHRRQEEERQRQMEETRRRQEEERQQRQVEQQIAANKQRQEEERRKRVAELQAAEMKKQQQQAQQQQAQQAHQQYYQQQQQQQQAQQQQQQAHYQQQQQQFYNQNQHQGYPQQGFRQQPQPHPAQQQFYNQNAPPPGNYPQQGFQGHAPHQQQRPPPPQPQQPQPQQQQQPQPPSKYMEDKGDEAQSAATLKIKRNILIHWALQPPNLNTLRPIDQLITTIHTAMPPAYGVPTHDYFSKFTPITRHEITTTDGMGNHADETKLKKAVRKVRVFLHPDKLPRDLSADQSFMARMLWDITSDSWEEFLKHKDELDWIRS